MQALKTTNEHNDKLKTNEIMLKAQLQELTSRQNKKESIQIQRNHLGALFGKPNLGGNNNGVRFVGNRKTPDSASNKQLDSNIYQMSNSVELQYLKQISPGTYQNIESSLMQSTNPGGYSRSRKDVGSKNQVFSQTQQVAQENSGFTTMNNTLAHSSEQTIHPARIKPLKKNYSNSPVRTTHS